jgi:hypothetical protein
MRRTLPFADDVVAAILRATPDLDGVTFETLMSERYASLLPYVFLESTDWESFDDRFIGVATMEFSFFSTGGKRAVMDLAEAVRVALVEAKRNKTPSGEGYIAIFNYNSGPLQVPNDPASNTVFKAYASFQIGVRPQPS